MTDKERLEEMEELLDEYYENLDDPFASTDNAMAIIDKVGYFVKRVQDLEKHRDNLLEFSFKMEGEANDLSEQNKRYREALEEVLKSNISTWGFHQIAREALEESE